MAFHPGCYHYNVSVRAEVSPQNVSINFRHHLVFNGSFALVRRSDKHIVHVVAGGKTEWVFIREKTTLPRLN